MTWTVRIWSVYETCEWLGYIIGYVIVTNDNKGRWIAVVPWRKIVAGELRRWPTIGKFDTIQQAKSAVMNYKFNY